MYPSDRIMRLDEKTASKIAAGEVVERPAMVIKELVENAIDAGATEIIVDIRKGGKALMKVTDNGSGIHYDDLKLVFERHATSKIRLIEDLYETHTIGFRGEALASICAVSTVELITMRQGEKLGMKVVAAGGKIQKISEVGTIQGTTIIVRDLFFNTPARLKFLKTDQTEGRSITELMGYLALSHPEIAFKYTSDDKLIFHTQGKGSLANAIFSVFESGMIKGLYEIEDKHESLHLKGFVSKFDYTKGTKSYQLTFVNGRYVKSDLIKDVIQLAYKPYMMNNRYPVCILFLEIPQSEIDVNIHPAKTEIKFHDEGQLKQFIFSALKKAFNLYDQVPKVVFTEREVFSMKTAPEPTERIQMIELSNVRSDETPIVETPIVETTNSDTLKQSITEAPRQMPPKQVTPKQVTPVVQYADNSGRVNESHNNRTYVTDNKRSADSMDVDFSSLTEFAEKMIEIETPVVKAGSVYDGLQYIGVFNKTYLIYEKDSNLYLIDQHAAHEKILFESYMKAFEAQEIQSQLLLIPEVIELNSLEMSRFEDARQLMQELGFVVDEFGDNSIVIREIPVMFSFSVARRMVQAIFENMKSEVDDHLHYAIAEKACKAAIKAHDEVHPGEQIALVDSLKNLKSPYTCPHGRPIVISFSLNEIERKFKRIL